MSYPARPRQEPLPEFVGTAVNRQTPEQRQALIAFVVKQYESGASLRELAEWTDRSQTAIRRALGQAHVTLRGRGAYPVNQEER